MTEEVKQTEAVAPKPDQSSAAPVQDSKKSGSGDRRRGRNGRGKGRGRRREPKEFEESILQIDRVTRVTKGGRQLRFRVSVVIGDKKGRVGFGVGKSSEVLGGIRKAVSRAKQNLVTIPIENGTIPHAIKMKFKASHVHLYPAPEGKGVIAGGAARKILDISGVKDVLSKIHGSRNRLNTAKATFQALSELKKTPEKASKKAENPVTATSNATE